MNKHKLKISNWKQCNHAWLQRGSLTLWMSTLSNDGIARLTIATGTGFSLPRQRAQMPKGLFKLPWRALEALINSLCSLFKLMGVPLSSPDDSGISKRVKDAPCLAQASLDGRVFIKPDAPQQLVIEWPSVTPYFRPEPHRA